MRKIDNWGQEVLIPSKEEWKVLLREKKYNGHELGRMTCEFAERDLAVLSQNPDITLGLVNHPGRYAYLRLLNINGTLYRVHFEDVICESCNQRSGMSATADFASYSGALKSKAAIEEMSKLPIMSCKKCGNKLNRRQTLWFAQH